MKSCPWCISTSHPGRRHEYVKQKKGGIIWHTQGAAKHVILLAAK